MQRDRSVFGLPSFGNPPSYFKAALHRNVERRPISSRLAARNNLLEHCLSYKFYDLLASA